MSERRPDDVLARCIGMVNAAIDPKGDRAWHWGVVTEELERARRSEAEQAEQLRQKDEVIRALADALVRGAPRSIGLEDVPCWCSLSDAHDAAPSQTCALNTAALAKAGRKP